MTAVLLRRHPDADEDHNIQWNWACNVLCPWDIFSYIVEPKVCYNVIAQTTAREFPQFTWDHTEEVGGNQLDFWTINPVFFLIAYLLFFVYMKRTIDLFRLQFVMCNRKMVL